MDDRDAVTQYLQTIAKVPLLTRDLELSWGKMMVEGRRKIANTVKSKKSISLLRKSIDAIDEEDLVTVTALLDSPTSDNLTLLREYVAAADFDVLDKYCKGNEKLMDVVLQIRKSRRILIDSNLRLVVSVAKQYSKAGMPFLDLIQEGNIGLIKAVDRFDPYRESKLGTLATWWIRQAIIRALSNKSRIIRVPVHMVDAMNRAYRKLTAELSRTPTPEEMQKELDIQMPLQQIKEVMDIMVGPVSLQTPVNSGSGGEDESASYETFLKDTAESMEVILSDQDLRKKLLDVFAEMPPREEKIIRLKCGF